MAIIKTDALVTRRMDLRETSLLANFYTRDFGKITGELKGIRADPAKFASSVELFSLNEVIYYQKHSGVHLVSQCDLKEAFSGARHDLALIAAASQVAELLDSVMAPEDKNEQVFALALSALSSLAARQNADKIATVFKIKLLSLSGFRPHLDSCVSCQTQSFDQPKFSLRLGGLLCRACAGKDAAARSIFRGTVATIMHIERNDFKNTLSLGMSPQIKRELELVLNAFLQFHLGRDLRTQRTMRKLDNAGAL
jgi:DNA repair protein RecO (recombination protein O)